MHIDYMYNSIQHDMRMNVILAHQLKWEEKFHLQRFRHEIMIIFDLKIFLVDLEKIKKKKNHFTIRNSLIDHMWERFTNEDVYVKMYYVISKM